MTNDKEAVEHQIARLIEPHLSGERGTSDADYAADRAALDLAETILAIPEIAEGLRLIAPFAVFPGGHSTPPCRPVVEPSPEGEAT